MLKNSRALITVSEFSKTEISEFYKINPDKIHVVYNATNEHFKPIDKNQKKRFLLAVSSPSYHKNFHGLLNAFCNSDLNI